MESKWFKMSFYEVIATGSLVTIIGLMLQLIENSAVTRQMAISNSNLIQKLDYDHNKRIDKIDEIIKKFYDDFYKRSRLTDYIPGNNDGEFFLPMNLWATKKDAGDRRGIRLGEVFRGNHFE